MANNPNETFHDRMAILNGGATPERLELLKNNPSDIINLVRFCFVSGQENIDAMKAKNMLPTQEEMLAAVDSTNGGEHYAYLRKIDYLMDIPEAVALVAASRDGIKTVTALINSGKTPSEEVKAAAIQQNRQAERYLVDNNTWAQKEAEFKAEQASQQEEAVA